MTGDALLSAHPPGRMERFLRFLPRGDRLPNAEFEKRHRGITILLSLQVVGLTGFGAWKGMEPLHLASEMVAVLGMTVGSSIRGFPRRVRSVLASLALITCSALLTHFSGGFIEAHFHFFVMLGVIVLYEDWVPFLLSIGYVAIHHGIVGTIDPKSVFNHPAAFANPWLWAGIHATFILWLSAALVIYWSISEKLRARNDIVLQSSTTPLAGLDHHGRLAFVNPAFTSLVALPTDAVIGQPVTKVLLGDVSAPNGDGVRKGLGSLRPPAGVEIPVEWSLTAVEDPGAGVGHVLSLTDLRERRHVEATLRQFNQELEERVRERTQNLEEAMYELESFNYSVSHDLRSPLRVVRGFSEVLLESIGPNLDEEARKLLDHVYLASDRMSRTIEALLQLSRINRSEIRRRTVDVSTLANELTEQLRKENPDRNVDVRIRPGLTTEADPELARVVLANLLSNAFKFTRGKDPAAVEVGATEAGDQSTFFVRDNGSGFVPKDAAKLFRPFQRLHDPGQFEGSGIGLATVARIVKRHGGRVWADGAPGVGATFYFRFKGGAALVTGASAPPPEIVARTA